MDGMGKKKSEMSMNTIIFKTWKTIEFKNIEEP